MNTRKERGKMLFIFAAAVVTLLLTASAVYGAEAPTATGRITESDGVNIRSSYSTGASIAGALPYNATFTIKEEKYTVAGSNTKTDIWYKIESSYGNGYIRADLASVTYGSGAGTTTAAINMRTGPGTEFSSAGKTGNGDTLNIVLKAVNASGTTWYKIKYNSNYYYVSGSYVTLSDTSGSSSGTTTTPSTTTPSTSGNLSDAEFETLLSQEGFPESYKTYLRALHKLHPSWTFRAKKLGYTWSEALTQQMSNVNANLVARSSLDSFKAVQDGTYDFTNHTYIGKDGSTWVAASKEAVAYYLDPRNWLTESGIFMFEPMTYDASYQSEDIVKKILAGTALPSSASAYYMQAAQQEYNGYTYEISPVYLATKTRLELGSYSTMIDGHEFTYGGKTYSGVYNVYNIGASDSADGTATQKGLVYAAGGSSGTGTSYLRPWNTLKKAVMGGAIYIADNFIGNDQYTLYYERFNVLNGLENIGTHQYATSVFCAATSASIMYSDYKDFDVLEEAFVFEIPVYDSMPETAAAWPTSKGNNNCYLDGITLSAGGQKLTLATAFDRFTGTYKVKETVGASVDKLTITTTKNDSDATVTISGNSLSDGENKITIKCKSSSGLYTKKYYVYVTKDSSQDSAVSGSTGGSGSSQSSSQKLINGVEATTIKASSALGEGCINLSWTKSAGYKVDYYEIYRATTSTGFSATPLYMTTDGTTTTFSDSQALNDGTRYYYRIRGVRTVDGTICYTQWSSLANRIYRAPETETPTEPEPNPNQNLIDGVEGTTVKASSAAETGYITLTWKKSYGYKVDGYEVYRGKSKTAMGLYTTTAKTTWKNSKNLVKGTRYYYQVRGYRTIDGQVYYTQWSNFANRIAK